MGRVRAGVYWWEKQPNFGDALSPVLLREFANIDPIWCSPEDAEIVSTGSVLDSLPPGWSGIVAGSGKLRSETVLRLEKATVLGLRGPLTAADTPPADFTIGCPAVLAVTLMDKPRKRWDLGVLPHWTDTAIAADHPDGHVISPADDPLEVIEQIGACGRLVTSSLHGAVIADAWGIPRVAVMSAFMHPLYDGGTLKFYDYGWSLRMPFLFGEEQTPKRAMVEACQADVLAMFRRVPEYLT